MSAPYYSDDLVTLYHGDCLDVLPDLAGVDLVVTSPPYNLGAIPTGHKMLGHWKPGQAAGGKTKWKGGAGSGHGVDYADHDDTMPWPDYVAWQHNVWRAMWGTLSDRGAVFWNHKPRTVGERLWTPHELIPDDVAGRLRQEIVWKRAGGQNCNLNAYMPTTERIYVVAQPAFRLRSRGASGVGDVWEISQEPSPHPAPFPVGLPGRAIETTAPRLVLDPFAGSGSTLVAARAAGVRCIGIEKSEAYCEMAAERLSQPEQLALAARPAPVTAAPTAPADRSFVVTDRSGFQETFDATIAPPPGYGVLWGDEDPPDQGDPGVASGEGRQ